MLFPAPKNSHGTSAARVVVTGVGIVTALGAGWKANAAGFRAGRAAIRPVRLFDVARQRSGIAAEIDLTDDLPPTRLTRVGPYAMIA